ncbi:acetyl/propionyl/methylcrotonyl-CoA carboxylase subunit alpha [Mesorhizobium sp.]|uniref:acetyl/propionyl/methylcrotonyl-CoA carboxylase subunit alpha n=1 Tax=Mesorhizobium sp. TaxID=1871066 RepID=UPI000FE8E637|nr:acetyl/propionyl/methylcrotonyl-CoA carboxylase subunit alpha [Mesorhizobium sp.]RWE77439.1 MAG: acetyl/propionyl/methylcrotonyl-CoA carboxylase subunit alpha [Mesorhizobium sp.]
MFKKILIANRGEIACRVIKTARKMGIATVAVYSDADRDAVHVEMADEAVHIGPPPAAQSYLLPEKIIAACKETGAEAVHPGYGFLSERASFCEALEKEGIVFIGPKPKAIKAMGDKIESKKFASEAKVSTVPGWLGVIEDADHAERIAGEIGYPVMIKASAGGGGKGMRRVDHPDDFSEALSGARREAKAAFGDDRVLVEKYVDKPRHIECQVFGDNFGNAVHLFERDCSAQRRHQKVIEEAPAPGMTPALRKAMTEAAVKAAKAINYSGAGTIEFIVDASEGLKADRFWFMEMNTRLQVEHPVTEMVTGVDLVEWQLRIASGEKLPKTQGEIALSGHAFEARLYAEDAAKGFLPATGTLHHLKFPDAGLQGAAMRIETGVRAGDAISPFYDPMIAKLVVHGKDRATALGALRKTLARTEVAGSTVNTAFLAALAADPDFAAGDVDTGLIGRHQEALTAIPAPSDETIAAAALAATDAGAPGAAADPWSTLSGYAHFHTLARRIRLRHGEENILARVSARPDGRFQVALEAPHDAVNTHDLRTMPRAVRWPGHVTVFEGAVGYTFAVPDPLAKADEAGAASGSLRAPMPGLVKLVRAAVGDAVIKGQPLLILEAMKMEHMIAAPHDGVIAEIAVEGAQVSDGTVLVRFTEDNRG